MEADHILAELKISESLNEDALSWLSMYDTLFLESAGLQRKRLQSVIIGAISPRSEFFARFAFVAVGPAGVYESRPRWGGMIRLILLNELADEVRNAPMKCFASRQEERAKGFRTIKRSGLFQISVAFGQIIVGLWRLLMQGSLNSPEMEGVTPEQVALLGREWLDFLVDTTPEEELSVLPKLEHLLGRERLDSEQRGEQKGEVKILTRQLQRRFGAVPDWATEKIAKATSQSLEEWSLRFVDAQSLEEVFADRM
ncbi:MAG: DUF4351 domain-containing protein [Magnetococcales bacterium]|nr:DUF4351 domain-containing protein [Magnetococcales bacterium]